MDVIWMLKNTAKLSCYIIPVSMTASFCIKKYSILLCTCFLIHVIFLYKKEKFSYTVLLSECISSIEQ